MSIHYFLSCKNCGYKTEIVRENHTWCYNCTKRFPNYYRLWKHNGEGQTLEQYQNEICEKFVETEIKSFVNPQNRKVEIRNVAKEIVVRRRYIKEGIPLDKGGFTEWDGKHIKKHYILMMILLVLLVLIVIFLE
jgi:hypothetical protein